MSKIRDFAVILKDLSHIAADLMECQAEHLGRRYKEVLTKILTWLLVVLGAMLLAIGGLALILWGVYLQLSLLVGPGWSAYILGFFLILIAIIIFLFGRTILKE